MVQREKNIRDQRLHTETRRNAHEVEFKKILKPLVFEHVAQELPGDTEHLKVEKLMKD